jgi:glyoxylase-like metal-dependent hydrolase (beta-lactamase superfamily II)
MSEQIAPHVHRLGSKYVNFYAVEAEGRLTLVDAGLPGFADSLEADLEAIGHTPPDIDAVVLTHSDSDHTGIVLTVRESGARVLIHAADESSLAKPGPKGGDASPIHLLPVLWRPTLWQFVVAIARAGGTKMPKIKGPETFSDGDVLDVPGRPRVVHTPGHTPGHCALHFADHGVLFVGDALCMWNPVTGDRGIQLMPRQMNVSNAQCMESLARFDDLDAEVVLAGHGEPYHGSPRAAAEGARAKARG